MAYYITPDLGLELADPLTIQAFETANVNANFELLEAGIVADRVQLAALNAGVGRGVRTTFQRADLDGLSTITTELAGDLVYVTEGGWFLRSDGATWHQATVPTFATAAARTTALAKAAAAYLTQGLRSRRTDFYLIEETYWALYNAGSNPSGAKVAGWYPGTNAGIQTRLVKAGSTAVVVTTDTNLTMNTTPLFSFPGMFAAGQPTRLVLPIVGQWRCGYTAPGIGIAAGGAALRTSLYKNTVALPESRDERAGTAAVFEPYNKGEILVESTVVTDYIELRASLSSAAGGNLGTTTQMWAEWVGPSRA